MRVVKKAPSMSRVEPGATATLELPVGPTYKRLVFSLTGTALTVGMVGRIRVFIDGVAEIEYKNLQRLIDMNSYRGYSSDTVDEFALHFFRADMEGLVYRRAPGIGTSDVQTLHVEIEVDGGASADLTMVAHYEADPVRQPLGVFMKVREYPFSSAVSGEVEVDRLPRGPYYSAIHLWNPGISDVEVLADQVSIIKATKAVLERTQKEASPSARSPISARATHVDWCVEGDLSESIVSSDLSDFRVVMRMEVPGAVDIVTETLDTIGQ